MTIPIKGATKMEPATPLDAVDRKLGDHESNDVATTNSISTVDEKKLVAKLDRHLIPLIMLLYTFSFLDRYACMMFLTHGERPYPALAVQCNL